jgi:nucleotide-binding universal stress UspA family protein
MGLWAVDVGRVRSDTEEIGKECSLPVVAGVDGSPTSTRVVARAIEQAKWRNTSLKVVHVMNVPMVYTEVAINWDEVAEAQRAAVWAGLEKVIDEADIAIERVDLEGYPPDGLVEYANEVGASLVVVGTRGRGDLASLILGSTSHRAIHLAQSDVLVVKALEEQE